jgi:hypothetical protein
MINWEDWSLRIAYVLALILCGLGIRRLPAWKIGRNRMFMAALSFFLADGTIRSQNANAGASAPGDTSVKKGRRVHDLPVPPELAAPGKWEAFRAFWQQVSDINTSAYHARFYSSAQPNGKDASDVGHQVDRTESGVLTYEQLQELQLRLSELFPGIQNPKYLLHSSMTADTATFASRMGQILCFIMAQRIDALGHDGFRMTRMAPSLSALYRRSIGLRIEVRIDLLLEKQASGEIPPEEYKNIIASIENDIYLSALIPPMAYVYPWTHIDPVPSGIDKGSSDPVTTKSMPALAGSPLYDEPENWLRGWEQSLARRIAQLEALSAARASGESPQDKAPPPGRGDPAYDDPAKALADLAESANRTRELLQELQELREPLRILLADLEWRN